LGDGCASWDNGFGYTYFNTTTGPEFAGRIRSRSGRCFYATACHDYPIRHRCDSADGARHPKQYDLVGLAMQEPQYRSPGVRELLNAVGRAKVPCMSIMNMPPLAHAGNSLRLGYGIHRTRLSASTARRASAKG